MTEGRKIQAPKRRQPAREAAEGNRSRMLLAALAAAGLLVVAIVGGVLLLGGDEASGGVATALEEAGCTYETAPAQEGTHTSDFEADPDWNTFPPTSGEHHEQPAIVGTYDEPVNVIQAVHNLEHGVIAVFWGADVSEEEVQKVRAWVDEDPTGMLAAPLPELEGQISLTAWNADPEGNEAERRGEGHLAKCERFDEGAFDTFRDAFRFRGPERFPPEALEPGM